MTASPSLSLSCQFDRGWCVFTASEDGRTLRLQACHARDSVRELAAAALALCEGIAIPDIWMDDDPTHYRWRLNPAGERLRVVIEGHCEGEVWVALDSWVPAREFVSEVCRVLAELSYYHDLGCYVDFWGHEFPEEHFSRLIELIPRR